MAGGIVTGHGEAHADLESGIATQAQRGQRGGKGPPCGGSDKGGADAVEADAAFVEAAKLAVLSLLRGATLSLWPHMPAYVRQAFRNTD